MRRSTRPSTPWRRSCSTPNQAQPPQSQRADVAYVDMGGALKGMDDLKAMRARGSRSNSRRPLSSKFSTSELQRVQLMLMPQLPHLAASVSGGACSSRATTGSGGSARARAGRSARAGGIGCRRADDARRQGRRVNS